MAASYTYLAWVRQGLIGAVDNVSLGSAGPVDGRIILQVQAEIDAQGSGLVKSTKKVPIQLFGPGDVTGFDARQVIRTDPPNFTSDFESNYFPCVEFDRPDFPWIFTPEIPDAKNQLPPWICLIVVERRDGVEIQFKEGQPLPVLSIATDAYKELPDLSEAWAWAHAQVGGLTAETDLQTVLKDRPELTLSRLMSPRRLKARTAYFACVVPTYCGGLQAGLGETVVPSTVLGLSWKIDPANPLEKIRLPVYYHWEFSTGAQGDFESLIWQLERKELTFEEVGRRKLDISHADYDRSVLPASPPVDLEGALSPSAPTGKNDLIGPSPDYQRWLQSLVNETVISPAAVLPPPIYGRWHAAQRAIPDEFDPNRKRDYPWLRAINLNPGYRVAAGIGAEIVREQQEQLMASAWEQVGDILRANMKIREAQLARAASTSIHQKRLDPLDEETFLLITAPVQARVHYTADKTVRGHVQASALSLAATSVPFRRMLRRRGAVARRFGIMGTRQPSQVISGLNDRRIRPAPPKWPTPNGMITMESLLDKSPCNTSPESLLENIMTKWPPEPLFAAINEAMSSLEQLELEIGGLFADRARQQFRRARKNLAEAKRLLEENPVRAGPDADFQLNRSVYRAVFDLIAEARWLVDRLRGGFDPDTSNKLKQAIEPLPAEAELAVTLFGLTATLVLESVEPCDDGPVVLPPGLDIKGLKEHVKEKIDPRVTVPARIAALIEASGWKAEELDFVLAAPDFATPMYKALAEQSQEWLLPGLQNIPPNTLALLESNAGFIEAFMVGLNHEMSRELLWRGFPTDQRGTYFRQFWDPSGRFLPPQSDEERKSNLEAGKDIAPMYLWGNHNLGENFNNQGTPGFSVVLLIRGDLLRRYPRATIYAAKAQWLESTTTSPSEQKPRRNPTNEEKYPIFRGELAPDINFLGFKLDTDPRGSDEPSENNPGWFIIFQQQPTEPRFGLDETEATSKKEDWSWRDLAWPHIKGVEDHGYIRITAGVDTTQFPESAQQKPAGWKWSPESDSAQIASITLQQPVRIAVHASDLLPISD